MAAYAALNSVMFLLQQIQQNPRPPITIEKQHMESLCEIVSFLQDFLENNSDKGVTRDDKEALESQIAVAAYAAEDIIESYIADQILVKSNIIKSRNLDQTTLANSNFQEQDNCVHLFCRGTKKMIRTLACSRSHKTDQISAGDGERSSNSLFCQYLQEVIKYLNLIKKEVIQIQEKIRGINDYELPRNIISIFSNITGSSTLHPPKRKNTNTNTNINTNTMVGFDGVLIEVMDRLTGHPPNRQILPIVGMGGIGKTTLARNVYENPTIVEHFHNRIWVTISQEYRLRDVLVEALSFLDKSYKKDENKSSEDDLGAQLYKSLCGRRYLIILDDVWSIEVWEKLMLFFPDNNNGSRIMITTRLSNVSNHFGSRGFKMDFLDEDRSWDLFCKIVFAQDQCCPPELEEIGKKIARNCGGLPLSIAVICGLLAKSEKTQHHWKYIAKNLIPIVNLEDDRHCLNILYLSYNHLPVHLKPCFLYVGAFPEDKTIAVSSLIRLWVAEGFLKPIAAKSLEEAGEEYLKDLIDRNLISIVRLGSGGKIKYCKIHDLLRDLCLREVKKDKFLRVSKVHDLENIGQGIQRRRRISIHDEFLQVLPPASLARLPPASLARFLTRNLKVAPLLFRGQRLLRRCNMNVKNVYFDSRCSIDDIFKVVKSRYLDFRTGMPTIFAFSICLVWNLQTLIIQDEINSMPSEIWLMSQLRHLEIISWNFSLPDPPNRRLIHQGDPPNRRLIHQGDGNKFILRDLQTLRRITNLKLSKEVTKRLPNVKKLQVSYRLLAGEGWCPPYCLYNLRLLNKLETLYLDCVMSTEPSSRTALLQNLAFPRSLKKLRLCGTSLPWEDMRVIGSLPHLQVLKLYRNSFRGPKWNPVEGEFLDLKFLLIQDCEDLIHWNANSAHFPCLEELVLRSMSRLKEIPLEIGQIPTLHYIELSECRDSVVMSASDLLNEQVGLGNEELRVLVYSKKNAQLERLATY